MDHLQRKNAATFARCQAAYDAMLPPEGPDPWPCGETNHVTIAKRKRTIKMIDMQALIDGMNHIRQNERAKTQMTLGKLINHLERIPPKTLVKLGEPHSYRGYYCDLAFEGIESTAGEALMMCRKCLGEVFIGYKGGEYQMGKLTPVWVAFYGDCGKKIMAINDDGTVETQ